MRKRIFSILLSLAVILSMMPAGTVSAAEGITYVDKNGNTQVCTTYKEIGDQTTFEETEETWLVVTNEDATMGSITLGGTGDYHLILKDGQSVEVRNGIHLGEKVSFSIYAQEAGTGKLNVENGRLEESAIGGDNYGSITINGGILDIYSFDAAAIGCYEGKNGGDITINGGDVTCESYIAAAIGSSNDYSRCGNITINGGTVRCSSTNGAGIGSADYDCKGITINGGNVTSTSKDGAGIGSGSGGDCGDIIINDGTVRATSNEGAGIGTGGSWNGRSFAGSIYINGGDVKAVSSIGAGIGGGGILGVQGRTLGPEFQSVIIKGGNIEAKSEKGAGIGMGRCEAGEPKMWNIYIQGGKVSASSMIGAGIGTGESKSGKVTMGEIGISDGAVVASSTYGEAIGIGDDTGAKISMGSRTAGEGCKIRTGKTKEEAVFVSKLSEANNRYSEVWKMHHGDWSLMQTRSEKVLISCGLGDCGNPPYSFNMELCGEDREYTGQPIGLSFGEGETDTWIHETGQNAPVITYYLEDGETLTDPENSGAEEEGAAPVNVGKYVGVAALDFGSWESHMRKVFRIQKAKPEITNVKATEITYGQKLSDSTLTADADIEGTLEWVSPDTVPTVADSEKKYFAAQFLPADTENYSICSTGTTVKVSPKEYAIEISELTEPFRVTRSQTLTYTYDGMFDVTMENSNSDAVDAVLDTEKKELKLTAKAEGDVKITLNTGEDENHKATSDVLEFTVWPEYTDIKTPEGQMLTYDGTEQTGVEEGTGYTLTGNCETDAGTYIATAALEDGYRWEDGSLEPKEISWEITKATPVVTDISASTLSYGQRLADSIITWKSDIEGTCEWNDEKLVPQAGTEEHEGVFTPADTRNYSLVFFKTEVNVEKADPELNNITASDITYGQRLKDSTITFSGTEGSISWKDDAIAPSVRDSEYTEFDAVFTPADENNYNIENLKVRVKVEPLEHPLVLEKFLETMKTGDVVNIPYSYDGYGKVTAVSGDPSIAEAEVDEENSLITVHAITKGMARITVTAEGDINNLGDKDSVVIVVGKGETESIQVDVPKAETGLTYTGKKQVGVVSAEGYTLKNYSATGAGMYTATAVLEEGYCWAGESGNAAFEDKEISWSIAPAKLSKASLNYSTLWYRGENRRPKVTVYGENGQKLYGGYTVKFPKESKDVGTYEITVTGSSDVSGTLTKTYKVAPKTATILSPVKAKKAFTAKWKKQSEKMSTSRITGYQVQIATDSKFTKGKKTYTVKGYSKTSKEIKNLKAKKKYYVHVRTYKVADGKTYYSEWSDTKAVTTR